MIKSNGCQITGLRDKDEVMKEVVYGSFSKTRELIRSVNRTEVKSHRQKVTRNRGNRTVVITVSTKGTK